MLPPPHLLPLPLTLMLLLLEDYRAGMNMGPLWFPKSGGAVRILGSSSRVLEPEGGYLRSRFPSTDHQEASPWSLPLGGGDWGYHGQVLPGFGVS